MHNLKAYYFSSCRCTCCPSTSTILPSHSWRNSHIGVYRNGFTES